jgi:DNA uptake protein ComE-like DNA-binding protein
MEGQRPRSRGVALVFVLWLMVLLSAVALEMAFRGHLRAQITAGTGDSSKAFYVAGAGVETAMADLAESARSGFAQDTDRRDDVDQYRNVQVGEGSFTLYAGTDESGEAKYGLADESAKLSVNIADVAELQRVPGIDAELATNIDAYRKLRAFSDLKDLLAVKGTDLIMILGEDQNENGLLDSNENDGDETWPPDNADGVLDAGFSAYLTTWSACRNQSSDGQDRVNINEATADAITKAVKDIDSQQADSIVARREQGEISSVLDLLDMDQVERVQDNNQQQQGNQGQPPQQQQPPQQDNGAKESNGGKEADKNDQSGSKEGGKGGEDQSSKEDNAQNGKDDKGKQSKADDAKQEDSEKKPEEKITYRSTGKKAFDEETVRKIADRLTTSKEDVLPGLININTAPQEVLACLPGMDESLAQAVVIAREGRPDGFQTVTDLLDVSGMTIELLKPIYPQLTARSDVYLARSIGILAGGGVRANVSAVLDRTEDDVRILYWREND